MDADSRRARGRLRHIAATALAILALAGLGGCGGGAGNPSSSSSGGWLSGTTKWFSGSKTIAVAPIVGAPPSVAQDLAEALIPAGKERNLTLVPSGGGEANYVMRGYLVASSEFNGSKISYIWDVSDAKGERVVRIAGEELIKGKSGGDPWRKVDAASIRSIAGKTTSQLAASLGRGGGSSAPVAAATPEPRPAATATVAAPAATAATQPRAATPVSTRPAGVLVIPVSGAPGDGQRSLPVALKKRLYAGGIKLANGPATNVYTVKGIVKMANESGGKQSIRIDWQVLDPSGKKLGTVSQQNTIPRGSLNGPWGAIADAAANAAAAGIIKLLPKSG